MVSTRRLTRGTYPQSHHLPITQLHHHSHHHLPHTPNDETKMSTPRGQTKRLHKPVQTPCTTQGVKWSHQRTNPRAYGSRGSQVSGQAYTSRPTTLRRSMKSNRIETKSREVKDELGGTDEDDGCQRDGRMCDTGDATSSTSCDSGRVKAGLLAEDKEGQQRNDMRKASKHVPGPPTPHPSDTTRPTHLTNPPRHQGQLKSTPTNVSQPEHTEYAPRRTVESMTTRTNQMRRRQYRATGGVSQSHHTQG
ncbi:hypothetical protein BDN67DRAFT_633140 [Paxillus ammoniavirescens]|nr:hypothetical protein BDN67DRAFT_633140 [Paxillus ammoniavirescens]